MVVIDLDARLYNKWHQLYKSMHIEPGQMNINLLKLPNIISKTKQVRDDY